MTITVDDLPEILEKHRLWLRGEEGGCRANLDGANLTRANLYGANLTRANLDGANLDGASLYRANLYGANLDGANLDGASLYRANLTRANLDGANLDGASLYRANLTRANLYGANLDGANLDGASLGDGITITRTPIQIMNLRYPVTIWDAHMRIGCQFHRLCDWETFDDRAIAEMDGRDGLKFWAAWKGPLLGIARADGRDFTTVPSSPSQDTAA